MVRAGIDLGTNTIRLLIIDDDGNDIVREMQIVRLGENIDKTNRISTKALKRTFKALGEYKLLCDEHNVSNINIFATSASRDAENKNDLLNGIKKIIGFEPKIIGGDLEAELSFKGAVSSLQLSGKSLVIDIGGGSTEFGAGEKKPSNTRSINIGSVRVTEKFFSKIPPKKSEIENAKKFINNELNALNDTFFDVDNIVGVAGTITTLGMYMQNLKEYDFSKTHGFTVSVKAFKKAIDNLLNENIKTLCEYMPKRRADVIQAGALIFSEILKRFNPEKLVTISEKDILDSIAIF